MIPLISSSFDYSYIKKAIGVVRQWPELIYLLNVEREALDPNIVIEYALKC